jgi:hypothetical protein
MQLMIYFYGLVHYELRADFSVSVVVALMNISVVFDVINCDVLEEHVIGDETIEINDLSVERETHGATI